MCISTKRYYSCAIQLRRLMTMDRFRLVSRRMRPQEFIDQFADNLLLAQVAEIAWPA